jgi:DNA (cytosine-5)-methyltransferase 1
MLTQHFGAAARSVDLPKPPCVTVDRTGIVEPFVFPTNQGRERVRGLRSTEDPLDTVVTKDMKGLVAPFMLSQGAGGAPRETDEPVPTIPTDGAHAILVAYYGTGKSRSVSEPLATATTKDRFAFVVGAFGERPGQAPRTRSIEEPAPTLCAQGRIPLVEAHAPADVAAVTLEDLAHVDILFRMMEPDELAGAMGFPRRYKFTGNKTERTRQIGNAVAVNTARALVAAIMADKLAGGAA